MPINLLLLLLQCIYFGYPCKFAYKKKQMKAKVAYQCKASMCHRLETVIKLMKKNTDMNFTASQLVHSGRLLYRIMQYSRLYFKLRRLAVDKALTRY